MTPDSAAQARAREAERAEQERAREAERAREHELEVRRIGGGRAPRAT